MSTIDDVVTQVWDLVYRGNHARYNRLDGALTDSATELTTEFSLEAVRRIAAGDHFSIGYEDFYTWNTTPGTNNVEMMRAMYGSTAEAHDDGSIIEISARWSKWTILQELRRELQSWPRSLYRVGAYDLPVPVSTPGVDLDLGADQDFFLTVLRVLGRVVTTSPYVPIGWRLERNMPTAEFPNGVGIYIENRLGIDPVGYDVRVVTALKFDLSTIDPDTDLAADIGIPESMEDIVLYGTAWRLMASTEINRTDAFAQGESRVAEEVPATHRMQSAQELKAIRDSRITDEVNRLREEYGVVF